MLYFARSYGVEMQMPSVPVCTRNFEYVSFPCVSSMSRMCVAARCIVAIDVVEQAECKSGNTYSNDIFQEKGFLL